MKIWYLKGVWTSRKAKSKIRDLSFEDIKSIAVIRHGALGDMVLTRSFIVEARKLFPNARITISIISNYTRGVPEDLVDRVHLVHGTDQRNTPLRERIVRIKELGHHDLIFDLASTSRSYMTCFFNSAILKLGFPYRKIRAWMFYDVTTCRSDLNFEVNDMLSMLHVLGAKTAYPHVYNMPGEPLKRVRPYIVYFIGASDPYKCWPLKHFAELIKEMCTTYPEHDHLVLEGIKEWESADEILQEMANHSNVSVIRADTIEETAALMKGADLAVSNDTGIRHVAIVCGTPTVGIFIGGPYRYWPRYEIHDAVFPSLEDGVVSVKAVKTSCTDILARSGNTG
ncbi:MAG: glycosyltransferase family 9 protein [Gammaproteobacteria bacterium]|nr:glycosyltransferase family 9 protein [Gammaproteobacteria bacterium]